MSNVIKENNIIAFAPGFYLQKYLTNQEISQEEFAKRIGISKSKMSKIINGNITLDDETINKIAIVLGTSKELWRNLDNQYKDQLFKIKEAKTNEQEKPIVKELDYNFWVKLNILPYARNWKEKINNLRKVLQVSDLTVLKQPDLFTQYRRVGNTVSEKNIVSSNAWIQTAIYLSRGKDVDDINLEYLKNHLSQIRDMSDQNPQEFVPQLEAIFKKSGVKFVLIPDLKNTGINGAVKWINKGNNVLLMLNNRRKDADIFWFSLFHEIEHVFQQKKTKMIVSPSSDKSQGVVLEDNMMRKLEKEADDFARDTLLDKDNYKKFVSLGKFDINSIYYFAQTQKIAPGIVVGRLQKEGYVPYKSMCNRLKKQYEFVF